MELGRRGVGRGGRRADLGKVGRGGRAAASPPPRLIREARARQPAAKLAGVPAQATLAALHAVVCRLAEVGVLDTKPPLEASLISGEKIGAQPR